MLATSQAALAPQDLDRWINLRSEEAERWSARAAYAASRLGPVSGVADYGCGWMTLQRYLAPGTAYVPIDLVARDARTIVCNFQSDELPWTGMPAAAALGLLGYLDQPARFMRALAERHERAVVSYKATDAIVPQQDRRGVGLVNDYSKRDLSALLIEAGWTIEGLFHPRPGQVLWTLVQ